MKKILLLMLLLYSSCTLAERVAKMELGAGVGGQYLADYRGSSSMQARGIPIPLLIYRGKFLQAEKGQLKGSFIANKRYELNVSAEASLSGGNSTHSLREGMPELDSAFELGPSLNINLTGEDFSEGFSLRFPVRAVYTASTEKISHIGYNFNPKVTWRSPDIYNGWMVGVNVGGLWGSQQYHDYYYSVNDAYVTDQRRSYEASSGYSGTYFKTSLKKREGNVFYGVSLRYDNLQGAAFRASPLIETDHYFALSFAVGYFFWHSPKSKT